MKNFATKRNITLTSIIVAVVLIVWDRIGNVRLCTWNGIEHYDCLNNISSIELVFFPVIPLALLSIFTYKMRDEIFTAWFSFARWWVPLSMISILIAPEVIEGSFSIPAKWPLAVFCSGTLLVISLILIAYKYFTLKKGEVGK